MRLTSKEINAIIKAFLDSFDGGQIYLFGSRVDDTKRGGDIDLYIELPTKLTIKEMLDTKSKFKLKLYDMIGEQKIDIVISKDKNSSFEQEILKTRIELCLKD